MDVIMPFIEPVIHQITQLFLVDETVAIGILIGAILVFLSTIIFISKRAGGSRRRSLIFAGLCDGGKTQMFCDFIGSPGVTSYTSMKENVADRSFGSKSFTLVDVPGSEKVRWTILEKFVSDAKGLVFVIDSARFAKGAKDVAEYLYDLLSEPRLSTVRFLVACNKQDQGLAKSAKLIRSTLEKEFALLNTSRAAALDSTDGAASKRLLGKKGSKEFSFDDVKQKVSFCECTATITNGHKKCDLGEVKEWIRGL